MSTSIELPGSVVIRDLAQKIEKSPIEIIKKLMANGVMATINQSVDFDTAAIVVAEYGFEAIPEAREEVQQITISLVEKWNVEKELAEKNRQLQISEQMLRDEFKDALAKMLNGFLAICAECKKIRDDYGNWNQIDDYIQKYADTKLAYSICPECTEKLYPKLHEK